MTLQQRLIAAAIAVVAFGLFVTLGWAIAHLGEPPNLVALESAWVDHGSAFAWALTRTCYPYVLGPIALVLAFLAWRFPDWRARIIFSLAMLALCWQGCDLFQRIFARPRRLDWVVHHETAFSYPSSHAAIAIGFFGLWAILIARGGSSGRAAWATLLGIFALGIIWSRLALGAHYATDLLGGALLAIALVSAGAAAVPINVFGPPRTRS